MTAFRFCLQKALDLRRKQLDLEEARFKQQAVALSNLERSRADLQAAALHEELKARTAPSLTGDDLSALSAFRSFIQKRDKVIAAHRAHCEQALKMQRAAMLEARRRVRLLERLKERRLAEWQAARDKELETLASESHLAKWMNHSL